MFFATFLTVSGVFATLIGAGITAPDSSGRLVGGQEVDSLRQFPHHVYIIPHQFSHRCGGTILNAQWVLTSASCVKNSPRLELNFGKKSENNTRADFFSVSVNRDHVFLYPTDYDDIALIKIPLRLVFSETIAPIGISFLQTRDLNKKFCVMPGFNEFVTDAPVWPYAEARHFEGDYYDHGQHPPPDPEVDGLRYGMFSIVDHHICERSLGDTSFDEYTQLCVEGWGTNPNAPCLSDFGSGLIIGWPAKSELVGIFSMFSPTCTSELPSVFTYVPKYYSWIKGLINDDW